MKWIKKLALKRKLLIAKMKIEDNLYVRHLQEKMPNTNNSYSASETTVNRSFICVGVSISSTSAIA